MVEVKRQAWEKGGSKLSLQKAEVQGLPWHEGHIPKGAAQKPVQEAPDTAAAAVVRNAARRYLSPGQPNQTAANRAGL